MWYHSSLPAARQAGFARKKPEEKLEASTPGRLVHPSENLRATPKQEQYEQNGNGHAEQPQKDPAHSPFLKLLVYGQSHMIFVLSTLAST
jgi:hypothetical protein